MAKNSDYMEVIADVVCSLRSSTASSESITEEIVLQLEKNGHDVVTRRVDVASRVSGMLGLFG